MITVAVYYDKQGRIESYKVTGHADSVTEGFDPVCALVSVVTQTPIIGLERHLQRQANVRVDEAAGELEVTLTEAEAKDGQLLLDTMVSVLEELRESYGKQLQIVKHRR